MLSPMYHHGLILPMLPAIGPALTRARTWLRRHKDHRT